MKPQRSVTRAIRCCVGAALCVAVLATTGASAHADALADRHVARGLSCEQCHGEGRSPMPVKSSECEGCHGDNDAMAGETRNVKPNPHFTHLGDVACLECHQGHRPSRLICDACHKFRLQVP